MKRILLLSLLFESCQKEERLTCLQCFHQEHMMFDECEETFPYSWDGMTAEEVKKHMEQNYHLDCHLY